nr:hypothetical protein GCM10025732_14400 [Glycomyces mayteni]
MTTPGPFDNWLSDMDGVLVHEGVPVPGANTLIEKLQSAGRGSSSSPTTRSTRRTTFMRA